MQYIPGPSLADVPLPLAPPVLRQLAVGLADALSAIHRAGIVHRDVKPGNVILAYDGPVLVDLGIAVHRDLTALTVEGTTIGTPAFMAPEQLRGDPATAATDVWAWGAVLAYAVTGQAPFGEDSLPAMAYRIQHEPPSLETLPSWLRRVVAAALVKSPGDRPSAAVIGRSLGDMNAKEDDTVFVTSMRYPLSDKDSAPRFFLPDRSTGGCGHQAHGG
jgi:serine/threonine protein kinase